MQPNLNQPDISTLTACHECDLLMARPDDLTAPQLACPRCGAVVFGSKTDSISRTLALVVAGLILYLPANFLPILKLEIMGNSSYNTMFSAVVSIYQGGLEVVALIVLFCSMLAPLFSLCLLLMVIVFVQAGKFTTILPGLFRIHGHLDSWAMLEVYIIALLVAVIKLLDMAQIHVGLGLFCFIGLMLTYIGSKVTLDRDKIWEMIEHHQQNKLYEKTGDKG